MMNIIPIIISANPPNRVDIFPILSLILFPRNNPKLVKKALDIENIKALTKVFSYIVLSPIPTEKLSILTARPNINNSLNFIIETLFSCLKVSKIICIPIKNKTMKTIVFGLIGRKFKIFVPTHIPSKGIKKWYKPTIKERRRIWLFSKFNVPYASDNEKASILRLTAITITIIIDIKKPPITFY